MPDNDETGDFPTKNLQSNSWGKGAKLFDHFQSKNFVKAFACYSGCPVQCGRIVKVKKGRYKTPEHDGAEYESLAVFTAYVLNEDMDGIGDLLADGVRIASEKIGNGSEEFAIHVKGLEGPAHDPRSGKALAITYAVGNRGCVIFSLPKQWFTIRERPEMSRYFRMV